MRRLLDLFCGAGGAAMGYHRAGFEVVGVDIAPQPRYPFEFHQADAMTFSLEGFDVIHASPPCQAYSSATPDATKHPDLVAAVRERLEGNGVIWVIENVPQAPLRFPFVLCGSSFGLHDPAEDLWLKRHRLFECPVMIMAPPCSCRPRRTAAVTGHLGASTFYRPEKCARNAGSSSAKVMMGIDWMTTAELVQSIPPAYTEYIGRQLIAAVAP